MTQAPTRDDIVQPGDPCLKDPKWLASRAMFNCPGGPFPHTRVPGVEWTKEFSGQTTNGRIGRPVIRYVPLSWLGEKMQRLVEAELRRLDEEEAA